MKSRMREEEESAANEGWSGHDRLCRRLMDWWIQWPEESQPAAGAPWHLAACLFSLFESQNALTAEGALQLGFSHLSRMFVFDVSIAVA